MKKDFQQLIFLPLGGSGEIGMNLNLYAIDNQWIMVDCGISFADDYLPGIDVIMPDIQFISEIQHNLLGLIVTHAHEDHVGAVVHLWPEFRCPIYTTPFTASILKSKFSEIGMLNEAIIHEIPLGGTVVLGDFDIEFVTLTHSIPEPNALNIKTPFGTIFHTGDWKLDPDPLVGNMVDAKKLTQIGDDGVLALVCDSTNVFNPGSSGSENDVRTSLVKLLKDIEGALFCTTFASNIARVDTLGHVAKETGRHLCLVGRSLSRNVSIARTNGYLKDFPVILDEQEASSIPRHKILYVCTGCQGEARAAMMRIVQDSNKYVHISKGDTVVFSSKIIPGNETTIGRVYNKLVELGANVITEKDAFVHVSGHPGQTELKQMYEWIRPSLIVPVHGEIRHLQKQAEFAATLGYKNSIVPKNGAVIRLAPGPAMIINEVHSGRLALDGEMLIPVDDLAIVERRRILFNGALVIAVTTNQNGILQSEPQITCLGIPDDDDYGLDDFIISEVNAIMRALSSKERLNDDALKEKVRIEARKAAKRFTGKEMGPVTKVILTRI